MTRVDLFTPRPIPARRGRAGSIVAGMIAALAVCLSLILQLLG